MILPLLYKDFYKVDHRSQYPKGTEVVYSNITPRASRVASADKVVVFGIQYFLMDYLKRRFDDGFFNKPKTEVVAKYKRRIESSLGKDCITFKHIEDLHDLGYLPLKIKALPEGTLCPIRVPFLTIKNTHPDFFWLTNFLETIMCNVIWGAVTSATTAYEYKKMLTQYANETSDIPEFVQWQGHDFSMRGMFGLEAALISGGAHLLSFTGTDTIPAIDFLEQFYGADSDKELVGASVPATEHSVMCMGGQESELDTYKRLLTEVYPKSIVSVVSDTWDYWAVLKEVLPALKDTIMGRDGKLVIRPDSGDPVEVILKSIPILWDVFGGVVNSKGYKQLDSHIGLIYGDSITLERCKNIIGGLKQLGFASTNVVLGIGSYTYQYVTRDTYGIAMKSTYGVVNGVAHEIFKAPKTDDGIKNSAKGLLCVDENMRLIECATAEQEAGGSLETVFLDGKIVKQYTLAEIRKRLVI